jgi:hypothetical protein
MIPAVLGVGFFVFNQVKALVDGDEAEDWLFGNTHSANNGVFAMLIITWSIVFM